MSCGGVHASNLDTAANRGTDDMHTDRLAFRDGRRSNGDAPAGSQPTHSGWALAHRVPELCAYKFNKSGKAESLLLAGELRGFSYARPERDSEFADKTNAMATHVTTTTLCELGFNATALSGIVPAAVAELKQVTAGPSSLPAAARSSNAVCHGLIDELRLMGFPIAIGSALQVKKPILSSFRCVAWIGASSYREPLLALAAWAKPTSSSVCRSSLML